MKTGRKKGVSYKQRGHLQRPGDPPLQIAGEDWRFVPGMGAYQVSSLGRVRRNRILHGRIDRDGYRRIHLSVDGKTFEQCVHTLVLLAFSGPRPTPKHQGAHWDGDVTNNKLGNLRWATTFDQAADKRRHGTLPIGESHWKSALTDAKRREVVRLFRDDALKSKAALARKFGVSSMVIERTIKTGLWK